MNTSPVSRPASAGIRSACPLRRFFATAAFACGFALSPAQTPQHYETIYIDSLQGSWSESSWGCTVNRSATAPGRAGTAIEVTINGAWNAFRAGESSQNFLNEYATIEFDVYFHDNSTGLDNLVFVMQTGWAALQPRLTDFIAGWATMTSAQRYNQWHHIRINFADLHAPFASFDTFWLWAVGAAVPHFRLDNIRLGWNDDTTAPIVSVTSALPDHDQVALTFTTDELTTYRVEYGVGSYNHTLTGDANNWQTQVTEVLPIVPLGATVQYRIVASDHRTDPSATPNQGVRTGTVVIVDPPPPAAVTATITANPGAAHSISPWIYGINNDIEASGLRNIPFARGGGNRSTAYNWENNFSNAGKDYQYQNDNYLVWSYNENHTDPIDGTIPAEVVRVGMAHDQLAGRAGLITLQMQGYVAADESGPRDPTGAERTGPHFKQVVYQKPASAGAFTLSPSTTDSSVYMDEFMWNLDRRLTGSTAAGRQTTIFTDPVHPVFLSLDNEPDLWHDTHPEIQGTTLVTPDTVIAKNISLSKAIKDLVPAAKTFGPVNFGFWTLINWSNSPGFSSSYWFVDKYLTDMKAASQADGRRLVDVYDFHWYPETYPYDTRINYQDSADLDATEIQAIVQSPRSLWDPSFVEYRNKVAETLGEAVRIIPRMQAKTAAIWPGTELAITEYNNGGYNHIAGTIAQADNLGVFGQFGLFAANLWPEREGPYIFTAFKMYRDFDGNLGEFGDTSIPTTSSAVGTATAYISRDSAHPNRYVIVALNRTNQPQKLAFAGLPLSGTARIYRISGRRTSPFHLADQAVNLATWQLGLPALSVLTIEIDTGAQPPTNYAAWRATAFGSDAGDDAIAGPAADPDGAGLTNFTRYAFNLAARGPVAAPTTPGTTSASGQNYLTIAFNRRASASDLSYVVEGSYDLVTWTPVPGHTYGPGPTALTAQDSVAMGTGGITRRFLRVRLPATP